MPDESALRSENAALRERERRLTSQLDVANQALESFSYSVSHDLKTPLRSVDGLIQILEEDYGARLGEDGCRVLNIIHDGCGKIDALITALLDFSQSVRQELDPVRIDMAALVREAVCQIMAAHSGPTPIIDIADVPEGVGDVTQLRQVWRQLLANALKFSSRRQQPHLRISGRVEADEVIYLVEDNGAGFDMKYAHKLFGLFQRLHKIEDFPGTGVGLAIVQKIIQRHGGRICGQGTTDGGARFQFTLPVEEITD